MHAAALALPPTPEAGLCAAATPPLGMAAYYVQRAAHYERVYHKPERQADLRAIEATLAEPFTGRRVLEVACGTGWWTPHGAARAQHWRATDLSPETLAIAQTKPRPAGVVRFQQADAYSLAELGDEFFDAAFAGCWWSHVPLARLPGWLDTLHARLLPGAVVVVLDNRFVQTSSTPINRHDAEGNSYQLRTLDDGSVHEVVKNFPTPEQAAAMLGPRATALTWRDHSHYWVLQYRLT